MPKLGGSSSISENIQKHLNMYSKVHKNIKGFICADYVTPNSCKILNTPTPCIQSYCYTALPISS